MHHHHPHLQQHHQHRRRKKRPNYGIRTVHIARGLNGFGFTISGQKPCILSQIVSTSPADIAGLRPGDFLISVNGLNVSKLPHESVVQLIGNSFGTIRMQIAENYFSDSSDEDNIINHNANQQHHNIQQQNRVKSSYMQHKVKINRLKNRSPYKASGRLTNDNNEADTTFHYQNENIPSTSTHHMEILHPVIEDLPENNITTNNTIQSPKAVKDIANVSAIVKIENLNESNELNASTTSLEYRVIVGYLGTIEMPKQIATSSKLQTVRSCIRKLRQEKRNPSTVLMRILPNCLILKNAKGKILATYPSSRLNYVSSSSESENRFFGLVTSAIYANIDEGHYDARDVIISNSCHVFVVDSKFCDHITHEERAAEFQIICTKDPISNLCLEFPNNSEYVVNLIRSMYTMKALPPAVRHARKNIDIQSAARGPPPDPLSNSPQPSNHSEVTTISSNSDSGIHGFHNDCVNISDRILVVDFPGLMMNRLANAAPRPLGICNEIDTENVQDNSPKQKNPIENKSKLTVRAMPDPKLRIPDLLANFSISNNSGKNCVHTLITTRSCDDVISSVERADEYITLKKPLQMSMDDISMLSNPMISSRDFKKNIKGDQKENHVFLAPTKPAAKKSQKTSSNGDQLIKDLKEKISYKLRPNVFGMQSKAGSYENLKRKSLDADAKCMKNSSANKISNNDFEMWGSLQELNKINERSVDGDNCYIDGTYSEPNLLSRALPSNASSPFRRWGQSSFRGPKTQTSTPPLAKRPSSLAASDNDVYSKSMDDLIDNASSHSNLLLPRSGGSSLSSVQGKGVQDNNNNSVENWGLSFEKLLHDPAGLHTFSEFLKKEFSAENIYFWTACERYRLIDNESERSAIAIDIFSKHLSNGANEPVNIDSHARNLAEQNLSKAERDLFCPAQKQIFNLMKFDSYQRFIRSDLYKKCIDAEQKKQPLPYPGELLEESLKIENSIPVPSKLKKSASNAEDRRRKSLLPWHRKVRCKSRDRAENSESVQSLTKSQSSASSLKPPTPIIGGDLHSSRSSLSSFDAHQQSIEEIKNCSLCRVILSDGATTVCQCRVNETIFQLVERLLEKRLIEYNCFDVMLNGTTKPIDLESPAITLAGKEIVVEQRVTFKLDLPDPKVISVKSKPKKLLCDVLRPILQKYNYRFDEVEVLMRDTHEKLNLNNPVTIADGHRLQVVIIKPQQEQRTFKPSLNGFSYTGNNNFPIKNFTNTNSTQQSTLDEITNKVFNELLQGKVETNKSAEDLSSIRSDDCASSTSSIFERLKRRDSTSGFKFSKPKNKINCGVPEVTQSDDTLSTTTQKTAISDTGVKKPLIAKWKTGVKLQVPGRVPNQDEFLEGLKKAQRARLEDQRGTEINSELPEFLKNKANAAIKLRKLRENLSPINKQSDSDSNEINHRNSLDSSEQRPQPAPRFSISKSASSIAITVNSINTNKIDLNSSNTSQSDQINSSGNSLNLSTNSSNDYENIINAKGPPPLPPKPKILPIKPSNWGQQSSTSTSPVTNKISMRNAYLDQPSSSFV